jgi:tight adherence protein B
MVHGARRTLARPWLVAAAVLTSVLMGASTARAADSGGIDHVESRDGSFQVLYSLPDLGGVAPGLGGVTATFEGKAAKAQATSASSASSAIRRTAVLAIDASNSMAGAKFAQAKAAAKTYLDSIPADVYVGVVSFAGTVTVVQAPSLDRAASRRLVDGLSLSLGTRLYDGVSRSVDLLGTSGQREVLVLSDGRDTTGASMAGVRRKIAATRTTVDVIALAQNAADKARTAPLADAGHGRVITAATADDLSRVFTSEALKLSSQLLVTVTPASGTKPGEGTLTVAVPAGGRTYTQSAFVRFSPVAAAGRPTAKASLRPASPGFTLPANAMLGAVTAIGLALLILLLAVFGGAGKPDMSIEKRVAMYTGKAGVQRMPTAAPVGVKAQAVDLASRALAGSSGFEARLGLRLEGAGISFKPAEWLLLHAGIAMGATAVALALTGGDLLFMVVALVLGLVAPWMYLGSRRNRRLKAFNSQLPQTLQLMGGSLQAGLSLAQGMDTILREGTDPIAGEFRRALVETRLGVGVEDALDSVADRMNSDDFRWTVMAIRIQREVGGNLAELLGNVARTMREREYLRRQVKSLSAEGRFSAYILLSMPPAVMLYEATVNRAYLTPLLTTRIGWAMLAVMGILMFVGAFAMKRIIKLEV